MPTPQTEVGMDSSIADGLRKQLEPWSQYYSSYIGNEPFFVAPSNDIIDKHIAAYIEKAKDHAATILNTTPDKLSLAKSYLARYAKLQKAGPFSPEEYTQVILALGELDRTNGLPLLQVSKEWKPFSLKSGKMLCVPHHTPQFYEGNGGGLAHISVWVRTDATSQ
ncbi:hypothetical protein K469DRAFT_684403 [Zopfia rhizophila CBS 207.26]|uniref:Uncharacterized protein n=1 Tax=Zopfia rhizophila CBS 207.26 TaxID=1314779 RepID=A0A6A6D802_9PEZI|nr:hypothetical protein K469DRAFT_684403 [Zopfia rhizophila CBS 207.26]